MGDEQKKEKNKNYVEAGIIKVSDDLYNIRVSRRMYVSENQPHKQFFRRKNNVKGLNQARRVKRELMDELAIEATKYDGSDVKWSTVREDYHSYLEGRYRAGALEASTMKNAIQTFDKYTRSWDDKWLSSITPPFLNAFISDEQLMKEIKPATRQSLLKFIRGALKRQILLGRIKYDPTAGLVINVKKKENEPVSMKSTDVFRVIDFAQNCDEEWSKEWALVYAVAYYCGARSGELWAMTWKDIILDGPGYKRLIIRHSYDWKTEKIKPTKGKKSRTVPISDDLEETLRQLKEKYPNSEYVLPRIPDWKRGKSAEIIREYQEALGIEQTNFHSLRGSFITNLLLENEPLIKVMALAGHENISTTRRYLRAIGDELEGSTQVLNRKNKVIKADFSGGKKPA